nr:MULTISPECIES: right-handed parallel beta-helix repeat-containing protein [unclassified Rhizobium]
MKLPPGARITRQIVIEGSASSGLTLDCNGAILDGSALPEESEVGQLLVRSKPDQPVWDRPEDITVRGCHILGSAKVYGIGLSGNADRVRASSLKPNHTAFVQASAPTRVTFSEMVFETTGRLPLYISPGATYVSVSSSVFKGRSRTVAIYLDAETKHTLIEDSDFEITTKRRELIAIDGAANNTIQNNIFRDASNGGIFLYRNCGEAGAIRHQAPQFNVISGNEFFVKRRSSRPAIWLNSRNGKQPFCFRDERYPFGSSLDPMDNAKNNRVIGNIVFGAGPSSFRNAAPSNVLLNNSFRR